MNTKLLSYITSVSVAATLLGVAFSSLELALFAVAVSAFIVLIAAMDYAPRPCYAYEACGIRTASERLPLAG